MRVIRNNIFFGVLVFLLLVNLLVLFDFHYFYLRAALSFIFLVTIPGLLVMLMLKIKKIGFWEYLVYTIGLSVAFLIFFGLTANWVLPLFGVARPLSPTPLLISFDVCLLIFWFIACKRNKGNSLKIKFPKLDWINQCLLMIPVIFPVLSILGAISLNNNGTNRFTMFMLGGIAVFVLLVVLFRNKLNKNIYPLAIFFISLPLLLMTSLRGWYTTGHDNQQEYFVFQLTRSDYHWDIADYRDPYNASLSITILPTIFYSFLNISEPCIYKLVFQIIFSFSAVCIFLFFRKYTANSVAFLSAFSFMSFPTFINDMPMLNRQEIATLFFSLTLLVLFNKIIDSRVNKALFFLFGFSMVLSHYSTTYVALALFILTYAIFFIIRKNVLGLARKFKISYQVNRLSWSMVLGLVLFTFLWNVQLTGTSSGLTRLITNTYQNMGKALSQDLKSGGVLYSLFSWQKLDTQKLFNDYVRASIIEVESKQDKSVYFTKDVYEKYPLTIVDDNKTPMTSLGVKLFNLHLSPYSFNYYLRQGSAKIFQVFIILGFITLMLKKSKQVRRLDPEYMILAFTGMVLLGLFIVLPLVSIEYGTLRFFQQILVILSLPLITGSLAILTFFGEKKRLLISSCIFEIFFLSLSGFIPQITGDFYPQLHLSNSGIYYDSYYTHESEIDSIKWLTANFISKYDIQSNLSAHSKLLANASLLSYKKILPLVIRKDSYVFLDYTNVEKQKNIVSVKGDLVTYKYPMEFLDQNKDLIYNNQGSKIFK